MQRLNKLKSKIGIPDDLINIPFFEYKKNKLLIFNYKKLIDFDTEAIELANFLVEGDNLKIETLNKSYITISGTIFNINFKNV